MDPLGGYLHMMFVAAPTTSPFLKSGKLRALGVSSARRSHFLPEIPTIAEAGVLSYEVNSWSALFVQAGTPAATVKTIHAEVGKGSRQADALEVLEKTGSRSGSEYAGRIGDSDWNESCKMGEVYLVQ